MPSPFIVTLGTIAIALGAILLFIVQRKIVASAVRFTVATGIASRLLVFYLIFSLNQLRDIDQRYLLLANRNVAADVFRYWWQSAYLADLKGVPLRVAVTAGPRQDADNWLMYYFMGHNLQNTLHYVPISSDGKIIPFGPDTRRFDEGDFDTWLSRLREQGISHVFSFFPTSVEIGWMNQHPLRFVRLNGDANHWAFFELVDAARDRSQQSSVGER